MAVVFTETWTGTTGAAWGANWTTTSTGGSVTDIQFNLGRLQTGATAWNSYPRAYASGMPLMVDQEIVFQFNIASPKVDEYLICGLRTNNTWYNAWPTVGYFVEFDTNNNKVRVREATTSKVLGVVDHIFNIGITFKVRFKAEGVKLYFKVWDLPATEPVSWDWTGTDGETISPGKVSFSAQSGATGTMLFYLDDLTIDNLYKATTAPPNYKSPYVIEYLPKVDALYDDRHIWGDSNNFEGGTTGIWGSGTLDNISSAVVVNNEKFKGNNSLRLTANAAGTLITMRNNIALGVGKTFQGRPYGAVLRVKTSVAKDARLAFNWFNQSFTFINAYVGGWINTGVNKWTEIYAYFIAPDNTYCWTLSLDIQNTNAGQIYYVDEIEGGDQWVSISDDVNNFSTKYGRTYMTDKFDAGNSKIVLDSSDGEFDTAYALSPHYGQIDIDTPFRIKVRIPSTTADAPREYGLFRGNMESIDLSPDAGNRKASTNISVVDLFRILENNNIKQNIEELIQSKNPLIHFPLNEDGSPSAKPRNIGSESGQSWGPTFENYKKGMGFRVSPSALDGPGDTSTSFVQNIEFSYDTQGWISFGTQGTELNTVLQNSNYLNDFTVGFFAIFGPHGLSAVSSSNTIVNTPAFEVAVEAVDVFLPYTRIVVKWLWDAGDQGMFTNIRALITEGVKTFVAITKDTVGFRIFINGVIGTGSGGYGSEGGPGGGSLIVNTFNSNLKKVGISPTYLNSPQPVVTLSQLFILPSVLTDKEIAKWNTVRFVNYARETTGNRIKSTVLTDLNILNSSFVNIDPGKTVIPAGPVSSSQSMLSYCQALNETEQGYLYVDGEGILNFIDRNTILKPHSIAAVLGENVGAGEIPYESNYNPSFDKEQLYTSARVSRTSSGFNPDGSLITDNQTVEVSLSEKMKAKYGNATVSANSLSEIFEEAEDLAGHLLAINGIPRRRINNITVMLHSLNYAIWESVIKLKIGDHIRINRRPSYLMSGYSEIYKIESISRVVDVARSMKITWTLSPEDTTEYWVMGTSRLGVDTILGY